MSYNTNNPVPSNDVRDLSDNIENIDQWANSNELTAPDRLGVQRSTLEGVRQGLGFYNVGTFAAGATLTNTRQVLTHSDGHEYGWTGAFQKVVSAGSTPTPLGSGAWIDRSDVTLRDELADDSGSDLIGFSQSATYPDGTVGAKLKQIVSITDAPFNAVPDVDSTAAIDEAAAAADFVFVPQGVFISSNASLPYWKFFGHGNLRVGSTLIELSPYPQNGRTIKGYKERTFGNYENAVGASFTANMDAGQGKENTPITGATTDFIASTYKSFDHVGVYAGAASFAALRTTAASTSFTATSIMAPEITEASVLVGMYIWLPDATGYVGKVLSVNESTHTATVDGWFIWNTGATGTPPSPPSVPVIINPNTKVWAKNANLFLHADGDATHGVGFELGLVVNKSGAGANAWGYDCITLGSESPYAHFISRGAKVHGFLSLTNGQYGFVSEGSVVGFESRDPSGFHYRALVGGVAKFAIDAAGHVNGDYRSTVFNGALPAIDITPTIASIVNIYDGAALRLEAASTNYVGRHITVVAQATTIIKRNDGTTLKTIAAGATGCVVCDGSFWY